MLNLNPYQTPEIGTPSFKALFVDGPVQVSLVASVELMAEVHWACRRRWYFVPRLVAAVAGLFLVWIAGDMLFSTSVGRTPVGVALVLMLFGLCAVFWAMYVRKVVMLLNWKFNEQRARAVGAMVFTLDEKYFTIETSAGGASVPWASVKRWRRTECVLILDAEEFTVDISTVPFIPIDAMPDCFRRALQELFQFSRMSYGALYFAHAMRGVAAGVLLVGVYLQFIVGEEELFRWPIYKYALIALAISCVVIRASSEAKIPDFISFWSWVGACLIAVVGVMLPMLYFL